MEEILQDETAQITDENKDPGLFVNEEAVNTSSSEPVREEEVNAEAVTASDSGPVMEEAVSAKNSETVIENNSEPVLVNEEVVSAESSEPVIEEAVNIEAVNTSDSEPVIEEAVSANDDEEVNEVNIEEVSAQSSESVEETVSAETVTEQKPVMELKSVLEALLFITSDPLDLDKIQEIIGNGYNGQKLDKKQVREALAALQTDYQDRNNALQLVEIANGWQLCTKKEFAIWLDKSVKNREVYKLSNSALETLSIIAYKQPLTRAEVEHIRGVDSGGVMHNLLEKRLVRITGRKEVIGHPLLYGTSDEFLQYFGLASLADLPMLEDLNKN